MLIGAAWTGERELLIQYSRLDPQYLASFTANRPGRKSESTAKLSIHVPRPVF